MSTLLLKVIFGTLFFSSLTGCQFNDTRAGAGENSNVNISAPAGSAALDEKKERDYFAHLAPEHKEVLPEWLKTKTFLRPAVEEIDNAMFYEEYKEYFDANMKFLRQTVGEGGYQYYAKGDFNRDGKEDFAVLLVDSRKGEDPKDVKYALAIFNAPFKVGQLPNYYEENYYGITNSYINFNLMVKNRLFLGVFESDFYCVTFYPKGKTYRFKDCMN